MIRGDCGDDGDSLPPHGIGADAVAALYYAACREPGISACAAGAELPFISARIGGRRQRYASFQRIWQAIGIH